MVNAVKRCRHHPAATRHNSKKHANIQPPPPKKNQVYDHNTRVPMLIKGPGIAANTVLYGNFDIISDHFSQIFSSMPPPHERPRPAGDLPTAFLPTAPLSPRQFKTGAPPSLWAHPTRVPCDVLCLVPIATTHNNHP